MTDNKYQMCPPLMSDCRHITNYTPNSVMNEYVKNVYGIVDNNYYRTFLQQNARKLMKNEKVFMERHFNCHVPVQCSIKNKCNNFSVKR
jgi:hypothetical protein